MTTPREADRKAAEEIVKRMCATFSEIDITKEIGWDKPIAAIIEKHMAPERERSLRMEKALQDAIEEFSLIANFTGGELTRHKMWRERAESALRKDSDGE